MKYFNLIGVICLAALCGVQWQRDRLLNLRLFASERTRSDQLVLLHQHEATIKGNEADLSELRGRLEQTAIARDDAAAKLVTAGAKIAQLIAERDRMKSAIDSWTAAVADRDKALQEASQRIEATAGERNAAIQKFNELANRYNGVVKDLTAAREKLAGD